MVHIQVRPNALVNDSRYEYIGNLSEGAQGFVQLARDIKTNEQVAIKFFHRTQGASKYNEREVLNHRRCLHPHIIEFKGVFLTREHLAIVMEYGQRGDLQTIVYAAGGFSERDGRNFFQQLMLAVDYMHKVGICMRDIKLSNAVCDGSRKPLLKLCDFGYSKDWNDSLPNSDVGTPGYAAPEVIQRDPNKKYDGEAADIWSCGCFLYALLFQHNPFDPPSNSTLPHSERIQKILAQCQQCEYHVPEQIRGADTSPELRNLLAQMLQLNPADRIKLPDIWKHPWFCLDLPQGAEDFNKQVLAKGNKAGCQSEDQIRQIFEEARMQPSLQAHAPNDGRGIEAAVHQPHACPPPVAVP